MNDKLYRWVRAATKEEREQVAKSAGITARYLTIAAKWVKDGAFLFPHDTADKLVAAIKDVPAILVDVQWEDIAKPCSCSRCGK